MSIFLFDPGIEDHAGTSSSNLGDLIIQEAVNRELTAVFPRESILHVTTQAFPLPEHVRQARGSDFIFVGGTNLLTAKMNEYRQWKITPYQALRLQKTVLLGVGWWQYQEKPNLYTMLLLKAALSGKWMHSARDKYTQSKLHEVGFRNVINTGCPTTWPLADLPRDRIPRSKARNALVCLTDYLKAPESDLQLLKTLIANYETVWAWPQGRTDAAYFAELGLPVRLLDHSMASFRGFLDSGIDVDYVGTRLHGGIQCLLSGKRSLILEIDNRAKEMARDIHLPTAARADLEAIRRWTQGPTETNIEIDKQAIAQWKEQFRNVIHR